MSYDSMRRPHLYDYDYWENVEHPLLRGQSFDKGERQMLLGHHYHKTPDGVAECNDANCNDPLICVVCKTIIDPSRGIVFSHGWKHRTCRQREINNEMDEAREAHCVTHQYKQVRRNP